MIEETGFPFPDIILKLEKHEKVSGRVDEMWKKIGEDRWQSKITGQALNKIQFLRCQDLFGAHRFIVEI